jgi:hypothetical protein
MAKTKGYVNVMWIGYVQTATGVVDGRPLRSMALALHWARRRSIEMGVPSCAAVRRADVEAPSIRKRHAIALSEAGLCAGNPEALAVNKATFARRCLLALTKSRETRRRILAMRVDS